ncbi:retinaldehyde-binding protein 1-like [Wyeomyia smithii]|uniref:retinaldehyde-binding protein 1-like n=1 Tax=Wyeomyia smithii TaxID=174621 RepID=UPI002467FE65|nr:retinaldehyde-binding protein 1-like [Wyeomyia smithii]
MGEACLFPFPELKARLAKIAKEELGEDDFVRRQSLEQMRVWLGQNQRIKNCRTDDRFLLRFLRVKKFSVARACEMLERYLTMRQTYARWCQKLDPLDQALQQVLSYAALLPVGRDDEGRVIVIGIVRNFDAHKYNSDVMIRLNMLVSEALFDDEANQIAGFTHVFDNSDMSMAHVTCWTMDNLTGYLRSVVNSVPIRLKQNHFVNVPGFSAQLSKYCLGFASEKLKSRIYCHRNLDELKQKIDAHLLPKEYGGEIPLAELNERFLEFLMQKRDMLLALDEMQIQLSETVETVHGCTDMVAAGAAGSFRKLQID